MRTIRKTASQTVSATSLCGLLVALVVLVSQTACQRTSSRDGESNNEEDSCESVLNSALDMAEPGRLEITSTFDSVSNRLNDWKRDCPGDGAAPKLGEDGRRLLQELLSPEEFKRLSRGDFRTRDVRNLRNSLVFARIVNKVQRGTDLEQCVELFDLVTRTIVLVEDKPQRVPLPVFETMLLGRGTARDRAWVFAGLLRQLRITAVVLTSKSAAKPDPAKPKPFLVGVLLDEDGKLNVYLFDTRLGVPVPAPDDDPGTILPRKPATLNQFLSDPNIAASLSTEQFPYPLKASDLKALEVSLVGHRSVYAPQMQRVFQSAGGKYKSVPFVELDGENGDVAQVAEFGQGLWDKKGIRIWPYPEHTLQGFESLPADRVGEIVTLRAPFQYPYMEQKGGGLLPSHLLHESRVMQLTGEFGTALKKYQTVRMRIPSIQALNKMPTHQQLAIGESVAYAEYWSAVCQFERGNLAAAQRNLKRSVERNSRWRVQARYLLALTHARLKNYATAKSTLATVQGGPQGAADAYLLERWRKAFKSTPKSATD